MPRKNPQESSFRATLVLLLAEAERDIIEKTYAGVIGLKAVFSDVEGTLVDANLPRMSLALGRKMGFFSRWQMAQLGALSLLGKVLPGGMSQRMRVTSVRRAMAGQREEDVQKLVDAVLPQVMSLIKFDTLAQLKAHQSVGLPLVL